MPPKTDNEVRRRRTAMSILERKYLCGRKRYFPNSRWYFPTPLLKGRQEWINEDRERRRDARRTRAVNWREMVRAMPVDSTHPYVNTVQLVRLSTKAQERIFGRPRLVCNRDFHAKMMVEDSADDPSTASESDEDPEVITID